MTTTSSQSPRRRTSMMGVSVTGRSHVGPGSTTTSSTPTTTYRRTDDPTSGRTGPRTTRSHPGVGDTDDTDTRPEPFTTATPRSPDTSWTSVGASDPSATTATAVRRGRPTTTTTATACRYEGHGRRPGPPQGPTGETSRRELVWSGELEQVEVVLVTTETETV